MKTIPILLLACFPLTLSSQTLSRNFIYVESDDKFEKKYGSGCMFGERLGVFEFKCDYTINCQGSFLEIGLSTCNPEGDDQEKYSNEVIILKQLEQLAEFNNCIGNKNLYFKVGEGIFIYKSDNMPYESKVFYTKAYKLNIKRFFQKFGDDLTRLFPNKKIFACNWGW